MKHIDVLSFDIKELADAMYLTEAETVSYFTDGRRVSFIMERRISREVVPGRIATSEGAPYDLVALDGSKWEVRSLTRQGIYFCPSYMVGSSRSFDETGFLAKLDEIDGYLIAQVDDFPDIPIWQISSEQVRKWWFAGQLGSTTKISAIRALELLMRS